MKKSTFMLRLSAALLGLYSISAQAQTWTCTDGSWGNSGCWSSQIVPNSIDTANLNQLYLNSSPPYLYGDATLRFDIQSGAANALNIDSKGTGKTISFIQSTGTLAISTNQVIAANGTGSYTLNGGTNTASMLNLASGGLGNGTYSLIDGIVTTNNTSIGTLGTGAFTQTGGANTVNLNLYVGNNSSGKGTYDLSNGSLSVGTEFIGHTGTGTFNQTSGSHSATTLYFGYQNVSSSSPHSSGSYNLSSGSLSVSANETIGRLGDGEFNQTGGVHTVGAIGSSSSFFTLAESGKGNYNLSGGSLTISGNERIGRAGEGTFTQSGGAHAVTNLQLAEGAGSGNYNLSAGSLYVSGNETIGRLGAGVFSQSGGTHTVGNTLTIYGNDTYNLSGGSLVAAKISNTQGGAFSFTGGKLAVGNFAGSLINEGTLAPGASPGTTIITGDYLQSSAGTYAVEIGGLIAGSNHDVLNIYGTATLNGKLQVSMYDFGGGTFNPQLGSFYDILTAEVIQGGFDLYEYTSLELGKEWTVSYLHDVDGSSLDVVRLSVGVAAPVPEPEIYSMLFAGMGLIGFMTRRRKAYKSN